MVEQIDALIDELKDAAQVLPITWKTKCVTLEHVIVNETWLLLSQTLLPSEQHKCAYEWTDGCLS